MTEGCALGLVARIAETGLGRYTLSMLTLGLTDGFTVRVRFSLCVALLAHTLPGCLTKAVLATLLTAYRFALFLLRSIVALLTLTFSRFQAHTVRSTLGTDRIAFARLADRMSFETVAYIGLAAILIGTTARFATRLARATVRVLLIADIAFTDFGLRAEAVRPTRSAAHRPTVQRRILCPLIALIALTMERCHAATVLATTPITLGLAIVDGSSVAHATVVFGMGTGSVIPALELEHS